MRFPCGRRSTHGPLVVWFAASAASPTALAAASPPRIFFTDLQSGPASGGEQSLGVFVTLCGAGFGAARGASTVTCGAGAVARYVAWREDVAPRAAATRTSAPSSHPGPRSPTPKR